MKMKEILTTIDDVQVFCIVKWSWNNKYYSFDDCNTWHTTKREGYNDAIARGVKLDKPYNLVSVANETPKSI